MSTTALSRRNFLGGLGLGLTASAFASRFSLANSLQNGGPIILGAGNHRYEWVRGWGKLPAGMDYGATHGAVQIDAKGLIYVNTDTDNAIIVFDGISIVWRPPQ